MERRTIALTLWGILFSGGIAALIGVTALPADSPYFLALILGGIAACIISPIGLLILWFTAPREGSIRPPSVRDTIFLKSDGDGEFDIEDSFSSADKFFDVEGAPKIASKRNRHEPKDDS